MWYSRRRIEAVLGGRYDAGTAGPTLDSDEILSLAISVVGRCPQWWAADPIGLADALNLPVVDSELPSDVGFCANGRVLLVRHEPDEKERALLVLCGIAEHVLRLEVGYHVDADVMLLAAALASTTMTPTHAAPAVRHRSDSIPPWLLAAMDQPPDSAPVSSRR